MIASPPTEEKADDSLPDDDDDALVHCENVKEGENRRIEAVKKDENMIFQVLRRVHKMFYDHYDETEQVKDVRVSRRNRKKYRETEIATVSQAFIRRIREEVLQGAVIVLSGGLEAFDS